MGFGAESKDKITMANFSFINYLIEIKKTKV